MDTQSLILLGAVTVGLAVIYWVDDGRIRVGVVALLGGLLFWRRPAKKRITQRLEPIPPDTTQVDTDAQSTDARIDAITHDRPVGNVGAALDLLADSDADRRRARRGGQ